MEADVIAELRIVRFRNRRGLHFFRGRHAV